MYNTDIIFSGYYGRKNSGDDAFVEVASWGAKALWNKGNIRFFANESELPRTIFPKKGYPIKLPLTYGIQQKFLIERSKAFISAGGSTFHSEIKGSNTKYAVLQSKQRREGEFKIGAMGVSIGPFKSVKAELSVAEYLKRLDFLTLRDKRSYNFVKSLDLDYDVVRSFDLAALLPSIYKYKKGELKEKSIGVALCNYESYIHGDMENQKRRNNQVVSLLKEIDKQDAVNFKFYIFNGNQKNGDEDLTLKTIEKCQLKNRYETIRYTPLVKQTWESIATCDFMISTRLHGAIFACFANVPFVLIEYHQKCSDFLMDVGYDEDLRVYDITTDVKNTSNQILEVVNDIRKYNKPMYLDKMKDLSLLNFSSINI